MVVYERYRQSVSSDIETLEKRRGDYCDAIVALGVFSALDVPERKGPTWSRRDGV